MSEEHFELSFLLSPLQSSSDGSQVVRLVLQGPAELSCQLQFYLQQCKRGFMMWFWKAVFSLTHPGRVHLAKSMCVLVFLATKWPPCDV